MLMSIIDAELLLLLLFFCLFSFLFFSFPFFSLLVFATNLEDLDAFQEACRTLWVCIVHWLFLQYDCSVSFESKSFYSCYRSFLSMLSPLITNSFFNFSLFGSPALLEFLFFFIIIFYFFLVVLYFCTSDKTIKKKYFSHLY